MFQSARQIWVWPNDDVLLDLEEKGIGFNLPGRFGFGRTDRFEEATKRLLVSICQADLGLAELPGVKGRSGGARSFNLPGRFGFGRTR